MKKVLSVIVLIGLIGQVSSIEAITGLRAVKCSLPSLHKRFNCTPQERAVGKRWLAGASIAAAGAAIAAIIGGISSAQIRQAKSEAEKEVGMSARWQDMTWERLSGKHGVKQEPGMWDKRLFDIVRSWPNDWSVGSTIHEVQNDLDHITVGGIRAAIEVADFRQKSPLKEINPDVVMQLKELVGLKLKYMGEQPFQPNINEPPALKTPPMKPNPTQDSFGRR